jgi:hypothetical protein
MNLVELDKQIKDKKVLSAFKDGVADGLLHGVKDAKQTHHYYKQGYEFGLTISERQRERLEEV